MFKFSVDRHEFHCNVIDYISNEKHPHYKVFEKRFGARISVQPTLLVVDEETGHPVNVIFEEKQFFIGSDVSNGDFVFNPPHIISVWDAETGKDYELSEICADEASYFKLTESIWEKNKNDKTPGMVEMYANMKKAVRRAIAEIKKSPFSEDRFFERNEDIRVLEKVLLRL